MDVAMFRSLRGKILLLFATIMALTAAVQIYLTHRDVGRTVLETEKASAQNVLRLIELNIEGRYSQLITEKIDILRRLQKDLKHVSTICTSVIKEFIRLNESGMMQKEVAQQAAVQWLSEVQFDKADLFLFDRNGIIVHHKDPNRIGKSIAGLKDMKGRYLHEADRKSVV